MEITLLYHRAKEFYMANLLSFFPQLLTEVEEVHTVMVNVPATEKLMNYIAKVPDEDVYKLGDPEYGKTKRPHITVLYGIDPAEGEKTKKILAKVPKNLSATLGKVSLFHPPGKDFDVLKIDVTSPTLAKVNALLRKSVKYTNSYNEFKPHVTIAYLKKGTGDKYVGDTAFEGTKLTFQTFLYSDEERKHEHLPMKDAPTERPAEKSDIKEAGYGGAPGGGVASAGWAGTFMSPQTVTRTASYPISHGNTDKPQNGNTISNMSPYDTISASDLNDPRFDKDEIRAGIRWEMKRQEFPSKDLARRIVVKNLKKNPKYYSDLHMYDDPAPSQQP